MRTILINLLFLAALSFPGCSVYKVDIRQGNVIELEQLAKLKVGMKKRQVTFLMGNPLLTDPFHADRWDYIYTLKPSGDQMTRQLVTLYFDGDTLLNIDDSQLTEITLEE